VRFGFLFYYFLISNVSGARARFQYKMATLCVRFSISSPLLMLASFLGEKSGRALVTHAHPDEIGFRSTASASQGCLHFPSFFI
jgi:hypothetical protein